MVSIASMSTGEYWFNFFWMLSYFLVMFGMAGYGFDRFMKVILYYIHRNDVPKPAGQWEEWPMVTIQLPMFNEKYVVEGLLRSVTAIDYPKDKMEIQILDDSTDDTWDLCKQQVEYYKAQGFDIVCLHRVDRTGFKAGALDKMSLYKMSEFLQVLLMVVAPILRSLVIKKNATTTSVG